MEVLWYLGGVTLRSAALWALGGAAILLLRVRSAAGRHAVWTAVMAGMLVLAALGPVMSSIPLRVLPGAAAVPESPRLVIAPGSTGPAVVPTAQATPTPARPSRIEWPKIAAIVYAAVAFLFLAQMAFGLLFTRRLLRASRRVDDEGIYESTWISAPMTAGWRRPRILLPAEWRDWERDKLDAVLAHERTHVRRGDWPISVLAGINRRLFWFHPLAWWLERRLATLAEQACDDAALIETGARESYAQALLEMAAAVHTAKGRLNWEAVAMAKAAEVKERIERILDENREIPRGLTGRRWAALASCAMPMIYLAAVLQLAPASAQDRPDVKVVVPNQEMGAMVEGNQLTPAAAERLEQQLARNPEDMGIRARLLAYYYMSANNQQRVRHALWLIEHHPESDLAGFSAASLSPGVTRMNDPADYNRGATLWRQEASIHADDARVLGNAAKFFAQGGDFPEAERLFEEARRIDPKNGVYTQGLAFLYAHALNMAVTAPGIADPGFAAAARAKLENSSDGALLAQVGEPLSLRGRIAPPGSADADMAEFGQKLLARAEQLGVKSPARQMASGSTSLAPPPQVVHRVEAPYPPLAAQARIAGVVRLEVKTKADGSVASLRVINGHPLLTPAAMEAVRQWIYAGGAQTFEQTVSFALPPGTSAPKPPDMDAVKGSAAAFNPPTRIRVGANVQDARVMYRADPVYPPLAKQARIEGTVVLDVLVAKDGHVMQVQNREGPAALIQAAVDAVKQWVYQPTLLNGNPVEVATTVDVNFRLP